MLAYVVNKKIKRAQENLTIHWKKELTIIIYTCSDATCMIGDSQHRSLFSPHHGEQEGCVGDSSAGLG